MFNKKEYNKKYKIEHRAEAKIYNKLYRLKHHKEEKIYYQLNKEKILKIQKQYKLKNRETTLQQKREWYHRHREERLDYNKKYIKNNIRKVRESKRIRCHKKYHTDIKYRLLCSLRTRIGKVLNGTNKSASTLKLLGCSLSDFRNYYESKFTKGMTWAKVMNGEIHCDHISPCASFDLTKASEQKKCFHYTNLQPLWALDNLQKGSKILQEIK